jgi:uncharacterized coiled-coil protein SlyX
MKVHTNEFKQNVKLFGRELDSIITYESNGETVVLGNETLNSVSPIFESAILKSAMKELKIDSNVEIPIGTVINYQFGVKTRYDVVEDYRYNYDYIDFGNYIVKEVEKQEDVDSYNIICYDKMLYSMVDYEAMNITYPITVKNYINAICIHLGLEFANSNDTFANYDKQIATELYLDSEGNSLGYTFRDVLDELAQVTASTICINDDDELEIRYINDTGDTIDAEYLKDVNVKFGEMYGAVNTIVLSRAGADKIYKSYPDDLPEDQRKAIEIADNQIMNGNDRDTYLTDILNRLNGLQYYLNDFSSTGITYYDMCDRYNIQIGEDVYSCIMFNDEINITQGLEENVYTDLPEESETDYTKSDKTDRRINQTYFIVDKQNQVIESVVTNVTEQNNKISQITQTVDELNSKISDIADITISGESNYATFTLENINQSEPIQIKVKPITENISHLYPNANLFPSNSTYLKVRTIRFHNDTTDTNVDYVLPDDLLIYDSTHYDEFYLDYDSQTCQITKKCKYNADGSVGLLPTEQIVNYPYPSIILEDGDYTLTLLGYEYGYLFIRLMAKNIYTSQFYTKAETDSHINQKADEIELGVSQTLTNYSTTSEMNSAINVKANEINSVVATKVGNNEIISKINQTAESITINANKVNISGMITAINNDTSTTIDGDKITTGTITASQVDSSVITTSNLSAQNISASQIKSGTLSGDRISGGTINISTKGGGYLSAGANTTHVNVSGLNVTGNAGINIKNLGFNSNGSRFTFSGGINSPYITVTNDLEVDRDAIVYGVFKTNQIKPGGYLQIATGGRTGYGTNPGSIYMYASAHITINAAYDHYVYIGNANVGNARAATSSSGPSSRCLKTDITEFNNNEYEDALKLLNDIKLYDYKYKYNIHPKKEQFGFMIDDLLENKLADKFFYFKDEKAGINKNNYLDYFAGEENKENLPIINFKRYDEETLIKYLLVVCKALQQKMNKLEGK